MRLMHSFVFSGKLRLRLARHLAFWAFYFVGTFITHLPYFRNWGTGRREQQEIADAFIDALCLFPVFMMAVYSALYIALPMYLRKRKISLVVLHAVTVLAFSIPAGYYIEKEIYKSRGYQADAFDLFGWALHNCMGNLITVTVAAVIIKIMKDYWLRQRENDILAIESIRNRLNLLKVQMHPRILFVALQSISRDMDTETGRSLEMILKLSDLLSYLLYESEADRVPLAKEVQMMENYIALKKLEGRQRIDVRLITDDRLDLHPIAPGLLLPLLEIGIERSQVAEELSTITVQLRAAGSKIHFSLTNLALGMDIAQDPVAQSTLMAVRDRLRNANFKRSRLDLESGTDRLTIDMQYFTHEPA